MKIFPSARFIFFTSPFCDNIFVSTVLKYYQTGGDALQTVYIDVYFLINFSLNVISLYFAVMLARADSSCFRLVSVGVILSLMAVVYLFLPQRFIISLVLSFIVAGIVLVFSARGAKVKRRFCILLSFLIVEMILGGAVSYFYGILERFVNGFTVGEYDDTNGGILLLALFVLLSIGIIRLFILLFRSRFEKSVVKIAIIHNETRIILDALVDSGNLLRDPFDSTAVVLVKQRGIIDVFPNLEGKQDTDLITSAAEIGIRLHLIPLKTGTGSRLLWAFKPDGVEIITDRGRERISLTVALDKEGGDYGGCRALLPSSVLSNAA